MNRMEPSVEPCPIERVETMVLRADINPDDLDAAQETVLVVLTDEAGRTGVGEADSVEEAVAEVIHRRGGHPWSAPLADLLIGRDPFCIDSIGTELQRATLWSGWSGIARHAVAAVDIALHDLAAKQLERPTFHILGGAQRERVHPYATCWVSSSGRTHLSEVLDETLAQMVSAVGLGFRSVKMELLFDDLATDRDLATCIVEGRRAIGDDIDLLLDFGYRWTHWRDAENVLREVESANVFLAEATLQPNDLMGHRRLGERVPIRIGGAEMASSLEECRAWLEEGRVDILQPDICRAGGLSHMKRICDLALMHGAGVVPHCWRTGVNAASARHLHAAASNVPMIEYLHPQLSTSPLRRGLVSEEPDLTDGFFALPTAPGLGVSLDPIVIKGFIVDRGHKVTTGRGPYDHA